MRITLVEMMDKLGVGYSLSPYETCPWAASDLMAGTTFSGEVRMSPDGSEIECELQLLNENPEAGKPSVEQLMWMQITPFTGDVWNVKNLRVRNEIWNGKVSNWEEKACNTFRACVTELSLGNVPNFDEILEREFLTKDRYGDQRGGGAGKAPKIRPGQLLNMKTGF